MKNERSQTEEEYRRRLNRNDIVAGALVALAVFDGLTLDIGGPFLNVFIGFAGFARIAADFGYRYDLSKHTGQQGETEV